MAEEKHLTVKEAAARTHIQPRHLQASLRLGRAPRAYKEGRTWKIPEGDLHFLEDRKPGRPWHRIVLHQRITASPDPDLTIQQAAAIADVNTARMRVIAKRLPNAYKKGLDWRIPPGDLALIKNRRPGRPWHK